MISAPGLGADGGRGLQPSGSAAQFANAAWDALDGRTDSGSRAAIRRVAPVPLSEPTGPFGAGLAAHLLGRPDTLVALLVDALRTDPGPDPGVAAPRYVLYQPGDIDAAIDTYEGALAPPPDHQILPDQSRLLA